MVPPRYNLAPRPNLRAYPALVTAPSVTSPTPFGTRAQPPHALRPEPSMANPNHSQSPMTSGTTPPMASPSHSPRKRRRIDALARPLLRDDRLGKLVTNSVDSFLSSPSWPAFVASFRGPSNIASGVHALPHRAAPLLEHLRLHGAPVPFHTPAWTAAHQHRCAARGPHASANDHAEFVREEMAEFLEKGFWTVLPFRLAKDLPNFRVSPLGVVPQRERRPRLIVDLSFYGVNDDTIRQAPPEAMQFGRALHRLLATIRHADPQYGPVHMIKVDIADGFYRVGLDPHTAPGLSVLLPLSPHEEQLVAIPLTLPMGWVESPPHFCSVTETAADLANARLHRPVAPPHRLERLAETPPALDPPLLLPPGLPASAVPPHRTHQPALRPVATVDVYMDDFIALGQGPPRRLRTLRRHLLHAIDAVLAPLRADDPFGTEPISVKKLRKGDASWQTTKTVLGWVVDTIQQTVTLPPHRAERLLHLFDVLRDRKRVSVTQWQRFLGELRSMVLAIPGGRGLFSTLQSGFRYCDRHRIRVTPAVRAQLSDFEELARSVADRPTRLAEIVPDIPTFLGSCDASKLGMGGVWFLPDGTCAVWRHRFPADVQADVVSSTNPTGSITNSDLELAGILAHQDVLTTLADVREHTVALVNDNFPAITRCRKGSVTSDGAAAYLLRVNSLHQRFHRYVGLYDHISGPANSVSTNNTLAAVSVAARDEFGADLCLAQAASRTGIVSQRANTQDWTWAIWEQFCSELDISPFLDSVPDPIPYLQVFAQRYRDGRLSKSTLGVRSRTVEQALRDIGQTLAKLGSPDPRLTSPRNLDLRLSHQLRSYAKDDPPPSRVQPAPLHLLHYLRPLATTPWTQAVCDISLLGFFFLCRPGEYTYPSDAETRNSPFRLMDVTFFHDGRQLPAATTPIAELLPATSVYLTFTDQKNGVRGERVGHSRSGDQFACPVLSILRRVLHLRRYLAPATTPLYMVRKTDTWVPIRSHSITQALRVAASATADTLNLNPDCISARSLRSGGAMALLCAGIDSDIIRLVGRWKSDEMLRYLHVQALPHTTALAHDMVRHGAFSLLPHQPIAPAAAPLLAMVPAAPPLLAAVH